MSDVEPRLADLLDRGATGGPGGLGSGRRHVIPPFDSQRVVLRAEVPGEHFSILQLPHVDAVAKVRAAQLHAGLLQTVRPAAGR